MMKFEFDTLYSIFINENLQVNSEDDLLDFINDIYLKNNKSDTYAILYETVEFDKVSQKSIQKFIENFNISDMNRNIWDRICSRLQKKVVDDDESDKKREKNFFYHKGSEFSGILNYLQNNSKNKTEKAFDISSSVPKSNNEYHQAKNIVLFNDNENFFYTPVHQENWISFDFKDYMVIPTAYTIKSAHWQENGPHLKSWKLEASVDNNSWDIIDNVIDCSYLNGSNAFHTFHIDYKKSRKKYKYLKLRPMGENWSGNDELSVNSIEIYGKLYY